MPAEGAEVDVDLIEDKGEWSPYLSFDDAYKLDNVRDTRRRGDLWQVKL
jgi:hypothetical protein